MLMMRFLLDIQPSSPSSVHVAWYVEWAVGSMSLQLSRKIGVEVVERDALSIVCKAVGLEKVAWRKGEQRQRWVN